MINLSNIEQIIQAHPQWLLSNIIRDEKSNVVGMEFICNEEPYYGERLVFHDETDYYKVDEAILTHRNTTRGIKQHDLVPR